MRNATKLILASVIATTLTACNSSNSNDDGMSYLRVFHASPDAPKVDVWLDGEKALEGVDYQQSSGQVSVSSGAHTVQIEAILPDKTTVTVLPETALDLMADTEYNVIATGKAALLGSGEEMAFMPLIVTRDYMVPTGARVQAIHSAPDAPMVDVFITAFNAELSAATPFADDIVYKDSTEAVEVPAGDYQIRITDPNDSSVVYYDSGEVNVPAGSDWVALATNNTAGGDAPVALVIDTGSSTVVAHDINTGSDIRVVHTISDAPAVDVWVNGDVPAMDSALYNLDFKAFTDYLTLPAAEYTFNAAPTGTTDVVDALTLTTTLDNAMSYTAIAIGNLGDATENDELYVVVDDKRRVATEAKVRAIHASTLAGNVDIYVSSDDMVSDDDTMIADIAYKGDTTLLSIMAGEAYVMVTPAGDMSTIAIGPVMLDFKAGTITTLVAIDDPDSSTDVSVISIDD
ncbi:hypothetical protein GCM10007916_05590 [Psychromonas marina]|uniref:DUF4397 domain-containing protein n=1 Tax=Psychromonas marina TaxID=88364 RepID=A0ABQ6DWG6_9GAMM|nr:DUF4397 domain-containing protein [Psychromonas marina]GLS89492.1 hypothetical protein GCM10007916_05590 [Psychromonas marina]